MREYLCTRRPETLCATDPGDPAVRSMLRTMLGAQSAWIEPPIVSVSVKPRGFLCLLTHAAPVAAWIASHACLCLGPAEHPARDAALLCLPDGRLLWVAGMYEIERCVLCGTNPQRAPSSLPGLAAAWDLVRELMSRQILRTDPDPLAPTKTYGDVLGPVLGRFREIVRDAAERGAAASHDVVADLSAACPGAVQPAVVCAMRHHVAALLARRRAVLRIGRAWCRYDGAPHGPRARYLRDLERGWTPGCGAPGGSDPDDDARRCPVADVAALFGDPGAYRAHSEERALVLRPLLLREACLSRARVALRLTTLHELYAATAAAR